MKNLLSLPLSVLLLYSCATQEETPDSLPIQVAKAYGIENFDQVNSIAFTWNVQRDSVNVLSRDWKWNIKERTVYYSGPDTTYT